MRRKATFDAGATPGLDDFERPDLKSLDEDLLGELEEISDQADRRRDEIAALESKLDDREERIQELESELENQENIATAAQQMADALRQGSDADDAVPEDFEAQIEAKNERIRALESEIEEVTAERDQLAERVEDLEREVERLQVAEERIEQAEQIETQLEKACDALGVEIERTAPQPAPEGDESELRGKLQDAHERIDDLEAENERLREQDVGAEALEPITAYTNFLEDPDVREAIEEAKGVDRTSPRYIKGVIASIVDEGGPVSYEDIAQRLDLSTNK